MKSTFFYLVMLLAFAASHRMNNKLRFGVGAPAAIPTYHLPLPEEQYFIQKLDHFNPTDKTSWSQRFWINSAFYHKGSPAFLMINGEAAATAEWSIRGTWVEYAKIYNASCFLLEHRFYGNSTPTEDVSTKNLKYLSSEQALADVAYFISTMKKEYGTGPWIVFGGSYAGSLAAWARLKYPHLIDGAVSSSGPLLAKTDFFEYFEVVERSLSVFSSRKCVLSIKEAQNQLSEMIQSVSGRSLLTEEFRLCSPLTTNSLDIQSLFENLAGNFAEVVQYNNDNRQSVTRNVTISMACNVMEGTGETNTSSIQAWKRYAGVNKLMLQLTNQSCLSYSYDDYIKNLRKTDWNSASEYGRQWMYQTCTEFGFYQTSSKQTDLFGAHFPLSFFTAQCKDIFGDEYNEVLLDAATNRTNILYGERNIHVERVIFVNGLVDPWHTLSVTDNPSQPYSTFLIPDTAHCADMYPSSVNDSLSLQTVRMEISDFIGLWLSFKSPPTYIWFGYHDYFSEWTLFNCCVFFYGSFLIVIVLISIAVSQHTRRSNLLYVGQLHVPVWQSKSRNVENSDINVKVV